MTFLQSDLIYPATAAVCAVMGSVLDLKSRRIPNFITVPSILLGLALHLTLGGWRQFVNSLAAGFICGAVFLVFHIAGGMGAGDVKLIAAVGCISGMSQVAPLLLFTALSGAVMAVALALVRGKLQQTVMNVAAIAAHHSHEGLKPHPNLNLSNTQTLRLPYALAIAGGSLLTLCLQIR